MTHMDALDQARERRDAIKDLDVHIARARAYERLYASMCAEAVLDGGLDADRWAARWRDSRALADEWQQQLRDTLRDQS